MDIQWRELISIYVVTTIIAGVFLSIGQDYIPKYEDVFAISVFLFCALCSTTVIANAALRCLCDAEWGGPRFLALATVVVILAIPAVFVTVQSLTPASIPAEGTAASEQP